jgi:hypothetical protein
MNPGHLLGMSAAMIIMPDGSCECLHTELIDLARLGQLEIRRATDIVFDNKSQEWAVKDMEGHELFRHASRDTCLEWERSYINKREDEKHGGLL